MMAKFNNFHELKQQVRLHIIQMNTQTFESYLALDNLYQLMMILLCNSIQKAPNITT